MLWSWASDSKQIHVLGLSNKALKIELGQWAAKISKVKVGGRKEYLPVKPDLGESVLNQAESEF